MVFHARTRKRTRERKAAEEQKLGVNGLIRQFKILEQHCDDQSKKSDWG